MTDALCIGLVSDTHGQLPAEVLTIFAGVSHILHAGDVGRLEILTDLEAVAPVTAVWGNTDGLDVRMRLRETEHIDMGGKRIVLLHGHQVGSPNPRSLAPVVPECDLVVFGHSHRPLVERFAGRLFINPGSAGAPRFGVGACVALLSIEEGGARAELVELALQGRPSGS